MSRIEELERKLEELKKEKREKEKPKPLDNIDFGYLIGLCKAHIDAYEEQGWADEDDSHYIYEVALEAVFGKSVWEWINEKM